MIRRFVVLAILICLSRGAAISEAQQGSITNIFRPSSNVWINGYAPLDATPPANVSGFTATAGDAQVSLSWVNPPDADFAGVKIQWRTDRYPTNSSDGTFIYNGSGTSCTKTGLINNGKTYYCKAFSYDTSTNYSSGATNSATLPNTVPPANVSGFSATGGNAQVSLSWVIPSDWDFAGVKILRRTDRYPTNSWDGETAFMGTGACYTDTGLTNGTTYYYVAFSYDTSMNYAGGVTATVTLQALRIVSAALGADGCFRLTFKPVSWITNYQAEYSALLLQTNWTCLGNPIFVSNGTPELVDSNPIPSLRFYRVKGMLP